MAELRSTEAVVRGGTGVAAPPPAAPESVRQPEGPGPLWRSLLFPHGGQRAIQIGREGSDLFRALRDMGVRLEGRTDDGGPAGAGCFDLVLEDRTNGRQAGRVESIASFLVPGGRWVVVLEGGRWIGMAGRRILRRARREGFETVETFHSYPSLRAPRILVPLDRLEPFRYFLTLAAGVRGPRQRLLALVARCLYALRLHRMFLSNLIVVARRGK